MTAGSSPAADEVGATPPPGWSVDGDGLDRFQGVDWQPTADLGRHVPQRFRDAIELQLARLGRGLDRQIGEALFGLMLRGPGGARIADDPERLRRLVRARPDRFWPSWQRARAVLGLTFSGGMVVWPNVEAARAWAVGLHEKRVACGLLGARMVWLRRHVELVPADLRSDAGAIWRAETRRLFRLVRVAQEAAQRAGCRVADDLADPSVAEVLRRTARGLPYGLAKRRLEAAARHLYRRRPADAARRVREVWSDGPRRRDLMLRHLWGVLHFNGLREALEGTLDTWRWPAAFDDPGGFTPPDADGL